MKANQALYPVKTMCRVLEVSRSGFYAWLKRGPSARSKANVALLETIEEIHTESGQLDEVFRNLTSDGGEIS